MIAQVAVGDGKKGWKAFIRINEPAASNDGHYRRLQCVNCYSIFYQLYRLTRGKHCVKSIYHRVPFVKLHCIADTKQLSHSQFKCLARFKSQFLIFLSLSFGLCPRVNAPNTSCDFIAKYWKPTEQEDCEGEREKETQNNKNRKL